jgi:hypothetical protein
VQTAQSRAALSLLGVLVVAKAMMLAGRHVAVTPWLPLAYFWQDVLVALAFGAIARVVRHPVLLWSGYALVAAYVALNVPVSLEFSSPLSVAMWRAAGAPLAGSVAASFTIRNVTAIAGVLLVALAAPRFAARAKPWMAGRVAVVIALAWIVAGASASGQIDTRGLHRNAVGALVPAAVPVAASAGGGTDWRAPFEIDPGSQFRLSGDRLPAPNSARGQNVLMIALESTAARYLGLYGAAEDPMPNLTRLAGHATVFDRMYGVYPESIKGLFATLCSRPPAYGTDPEIYADVPCDALPQVFKDHGYRTALFHSGRFEYLGMRAIIDHRGFDVLEDAGAIGGHTNSSFGIDETSSVDRMLSWNARLAPADRFFATYLPIAGHHPYATTAPGPFRGDTEFPQYLNALHEADAALGRLLEGLRARHRDRDTLIVIYGDHGEAFDQHDGNRGHTLFVYDENIHVPFLFALPGWGDESTAGAPHHVDRVASLLDTAPTILDLVGLPRQPRHQGVSLLDPSPRMALFFTDYSLGWLGLADGCWIFRLQVESDRSTLYNTCKDREERRDSSRDDPDRVRAYHDRLTSWIQHERVMIR